MVLACALSTRDAAARTAMDSLTVEADATWVSRVPPLHLASSSGTAFNALEGATIDEAQSTWFPGLALDERILPRDSALFVPLVGLRIGYAGYSRDLTLSGGVAAHVENLWFSEILLPGIGVRASADPFSISLSTRLAYARFDTEGRATDGHTTIGIGAGPDGAGILGDFSVCVPHVSLCLFAEPTAMLVGQPDFAVSMGLRLGYEPSR